MYENLSMKEWTVLFCLTSRLALTKKPAELHGGKIRIESEFGKGSRVAFTIPVRHIAEVNSVPEAENGKGDNLCPLKSL